MNERVEEGKQKRELHKNGTASRSLLDVKRRNECNERGALKTKCTRHLHECFILMLISRNFHWNSHTQKSLWKTEQTEAFDL